MPQKQSAEPQHQDTESARRTSPSSATSTLRRNLERIKLPCLRCGRMMATTRGRRRCPQCHSKIERGGWRGMPWGGGGPPDGLKVWRKELGEFLEFIEAWEKLPNSARGEAKS